MNVSDKRIFYPLRPRKARSRPPILGGQLIETEEQKNRFLRTKFMSLCSYVKNKYVIMFLCQKQKMQIRQMDTHYNLSMPNEVIFSNI